MKRLILILTFLSFIFFGLFSTETFASTIKTELNSNEQETNLKNNDNNLCGKIRIEDDNTKVSDILTFDEIVQEIANDNDISIDEATKIVIKNHYNSNITGDKLKFKVDDIFLPNGSINTKSEAFLSALNATYRTVEVQFKVTETYKPCLRFYCETTEGGYFWGIVKILNISMNRNYNGISKAFGGTVYANLEDAGTIFWIVNGDFYNQGTTTFNGGCNIGIKESGSINFNISYQSNFYAYCYEEGRYRIGY